MKELDSSHENHVNLSLIQQIKEGTSKLEIEIVSNGSDSLTPQSREKSDAANPVSCVCTRVNCKAFGTRNKR